MADSLKMPNQRKTECLQRSKYSEICQAQPFSPDFSGEAIHIQWTKLSKQDKPNKKRRPYTCLPSKGRKSFYPTFSNVPFSISHSSVKDLFPLSEQIPCWRPYAEAAF
ncbi:hypothetical protein V8C26DRAFT_175529 [Trichoderma gracile]